MLAKRQRGFLINVLSFLLIVSVFVMVACTGCSGFNKVGEGKFALSANEYYAEFGESYTLPVPTYTDGNGNVSEVNYTVKAYDADGNEVSVSYGVMYPEIGEYSLEYTYNGEKLTAKLICRDTKAPTVTLSNFVSSTFVGDTYTLPNFTAKDASGVDTTQSKIELFKGSDTTPVASGAGASAVIEQAAEYTVKVTVADKIGNRETYEYKVAIIDAFNDPALADNAMFDFDEDGYKKNFIAASGKDALSVSITDVCPAANGDDALGANGKVAKLELVGTQGCINLYRGRNIVLKDIFALNAKAYVSEGVQSVYFKDTSNGVTIRAFNDGDFVVGKWITLQIKGTSFTQSTTISSIGFELTGTSGACIYVDEITFTPKIADPDLADNMLLDYDEKSVYGTWQQTTKFSNGKTPFETEANVQLSILEDGDSGLPADTHGGALKVNTSTPISGLHTWFFQDYITAADIDGIVIRIYLSEAMLKKTNFMYISVTDYSPREIVATWYSNGLNSPNLKAGWNECVLSSDWLRENGASVVHGLYIASGGNDWNDVNEVEFFVDEIRVIPLSYVDNDLNPWVSIATYNKQEYVKGSNDFAPAVTAIKDANVSIDNNSLKIETTAANGQAKLNFGPNNIANIDGEMGLRIRCNSSAANTLRLYGYGLVAHNFIVVEEFEIAITWQGWKTYDLTEYTGLYNTSSRIYYFVAELKSAGTIHISDIAVLDKVAEPAIANNTFLFSVHDEHALNLLTDDSAFLRNGKYSYEYVTLDEAVQGIDKLVGIKAMDTRGARTGIVSIKLNRTLKSTDGVLAVYVYLEEGVTGLYFKGGSEDYSKGQKCTGIQEGLNILYLPVASLGETDELMLHFDIAENVTDVMKIAVVQYISDLSSFSSHSITVTGGTANVSSAKIGTKIDLTYNALQENQKFLYWTLNGERIEGNSFYMPNVDVKAVAIIKTVYPDDYSEIMTQGPMWTGNGMPELTAVDETALNGLQGNVAIKIDGGWKSVLVPLKSSVTIADEQYLKIRFYWPASTRVIYLGGANAAVDADLTLIAAQEHNPTYLRKVTEGWCEYLIPTTRFGEVGTTMESFMIATSEMFYFDEYEVVVSEPHSVEVTGGTANKTSAKYGEEITLTVDETATPKGKEFMGWEVNGEIISGNKFTMPNEAVTVVAQYRIPELALPEGAQSVTTYAEQFDSLTYTSEPNWGNGVLRYETLAEYEGCGGVFAVGYEGSNDDYRAFTITDANANLVCDSNKRVTFRIWLNSNWNNPTLYIMNGDKINDWTSGNQKRIELLKLTDVRDAWTTVSIRLSDLYPEGTENGKIWVQLGSKNTSGYLMYIDQIYVEPMPSELAIPKDAVMLADYAADPNLGVWSGYGNAKTTPSWEEQVDGRNGVEVFTITEDNGNGCVRDIFTNKDLSAYTTITFRLKAVSGKFTEMCLFTETFPDEYSIWIHANKPEEITVGEWTELTLNISDLNASSTNSVNLCIFVSGNSGAALYIDQIYAK